MINISYFSEFLDIEIVSSDRSTNEAFVSSNEVPKATVTSIEASVDSEKTCTKEESNVLPKTVQIAIVEPPAQTVHDTVFQSTKPKLFNPANETNNSIKSNVESTRTCQGLDENNSMQIPCNVDNTVKHCNETEKESILTLSSDKLSNLLDKQNLEKDENKLKQTTDSVNNIVKGDIEMEKQSISTLSLDQPSNESSAFSVIETTPSLPRTDVQYNESSVLSALDKSSHESKNGNSETGSVSSWLSIDDDIKVKKIKGDQVAKEVIQGTQLSGE